MSAKSKPSGDPGDGTGVLLGADPAGMMADELMSQDAQKTYAWGERAALIRKMALNYPELNHTEIAKRVGCLPQNVDQVLARFLGVHSVTDLRDLQANKADIYDAVQLRALASITQAKLENSSATQLVTVAAILEDKARLVRGQPTSLHVHALVDVLDVFRQQEAER